MGSETWPVRKENEVALQRAEMRMVISLYTTQTAQHELQLAESVEV